MAKAKQPPAKRGPGPEKRGAKPEKPLRLPRRSLLGRLVGWGLVAGLWGLIALGFLLAYYAYQLPPIDSLEDQSRRPGITVLAVDGSVLGTAGEMYGTAYPVRDLSHWMPQAVVAIEDRRFYSHFGIDPIGLVRAAWTNWRTGRSTQGGSTLTQQLAKNVFLTPDKTFKRKIQEVLLALWLEHRFTKDQILSIYLNRVYLGAGAWGVDAAAQRYFGKPATKLDLQEAAVIAGLLKAPSRYSPARDPAAAAARAETVLAAMVDQGYATEAQAAAARAAAPRLAQAAEKRVGRHFVDWVIDQVPGYVAADRDLVVQTTLDPALQRQAEAQAETLLAAEGARRKVGEIAAVVLGPDGAVRAMVGGRDYGRSQFNRATLALRQPGSSFKLFVYLAALEAGWTPDSMVLDAPVTIGAWAPDNIDNRYRGEVSVTYAFAHSLNTPAVRLAQASGVRSVAALAKRLGISSPLTHDLTLALGTSEVAPIEMTAAFASLANGGYGVWPYGIAQIRDRSGAVLWRRSGDGPGPVLVPATVTQARRLMAEVVTSGTGKNAALPGAYGKTGTSQDFRDAWFVGSLGPLTAGVWMGNDDGAPMSKVTGGDLPARYWKLLMQASGAQQQAAASSAPPAAAPASGN